MNNIFISYRRQDSADVTGRINDRLRQHYGHDAIFTDVDNIPFGVDFRTYLDQEVSQCKILLAVIGKNWISIENDSGQRRLNDPADFVRIEIESALKRNIPVVPLLVHGTVMPPANELPESLRELTFRNGIPIRPDPDFHKDMDRLIKGLDQHLQAKQEDVKQKKSNLKSNIEFGENRIQQKSQEKIHSRPEDLIRSKKLQNETKVKSSDPALTTNIQKDLDSMKLWCIVQVTGIWLLMLLTGFLRA